MNQARIAVRRDPQKVPQPQQGHDLVAPVTRGSPEPLQAAQGHCRMLLGGRGRIPPSPPWFIGVIYTRPLLQLFRRVILAVSIALSFVKPRAVLQEAAAARIVWWHTGGGGTHKLCFQHRAGREPKARAQLDGSGARCGQDTRGIA